MSSSHILILLVFHLLSGDLVSAAGDHVQGDHVGLEPREEVSQLTVPAAADGWIVEGGCIAIKLEAQVSFNLGRRVTLFYNL